jgi:hypothetical protein
MSEQRRVLTDTARALILDSRKLRDLSATLIQEVADLREFLCENRLNLWSRHEHRLDVVRLDKLLFNK